MRMIGRSRAKMFDQPPRTNLQTQLDSMSSGIKGGFFGGEDPNGADFANYGILRSMQGLNGFDIVESHIILPCIIVCKSFQICNSYIDWTFR